MIYDLKKGKKTYKIDDLVFLDDQPKDIKDIINDLRQDDIAEFDNARVILVNTGRVLVNEKLEDYE